MFKAGFLNDLWVFNFSSLEWSKVPDNAHSPSSRYRHSAYVQNGRLYVHGGRNSFSGQQKSPFAKVALFQGDLLDLQAILATCGCLTQNLKSGP
jgi:hypothetical protein